MGPLGAPTAAAGVAGAEDGTAAPIPGARVDPPAAATDGLHPRGSVCYWPTPLLHYPLQLPPTRMIAGHCAVLARHGQRGSDDFALLEEGRFEAPTVLCTSGPRYRGRGGQAPHPLEGESL